MDDGELKEPLCQPVSPTASGWTGNLRPAEGPARPQQEGARPLPGGAGDRLQKAFGYTYEDVKDTILPMARTGAEPTAAMGVDIPLAVLSDHAPAPAFSYFKQLFAQVTNPPIDAIREEIVTDTTVYVGADGNLLEEQAENCNVLQMEQPHPHLILTC